MLSTSWHKHGGPKRHKSHHGLETSESQIVESDEDSLVSVSDESLSLIDEDGSGTEQTSNEQMEAENGAEEETEASDEDNDQDIQGNGIAPSGSAMQSEGRVKEDSTTPEDTTTPEIDDGVIWELLQLQVKDLASELRTKHKTVLKTANMHISNMFEVLSQHGDEEVTSEIGKPYVADMKIESMAPFNYAPPLFLRPFSHFSLGCWMDTKLVTSIGDSHNPAQFPPKVDLLLGVPGSSIPSDDSAESTEHLYHAKRLLYLMKVKLILLDSSLDIQDVRLVPFCEDFSRPVLELMVGEGKKAMRFCIVPAIPPATFPLVSLPIKTQKKGMEPPSSQRHFYNVSIMEDQLLAVNDASFKTAFIQHKTDMLVDALRLLRVWLDARSLLHTTDSISGIAWFGIIVHLIQEGALKVQAHPLQIFKAILEFLTGPRMSRRLHLLPGANGTPKAPPSKMEKFEVVILDPSGCLNMAWNVRSSWVHEVQCRAKASLVLLDNVKNAEGDFACLFPMMPVPQCALFDHCIRVSCGKGTKTMLEEDENPMRKLVSKVQSLTKAALTDRAEILRIFPSRTYLNEVFQDGLGKVKFLEFSVCIVTNDENALRLMDRGPSAEDENACKQYRLLWGDKSEIRRFHDSSICESVSWQIPESQTHTLVDRILSYVYGRHLPTPCCIGSLVSLSDVWSKSSNYMWQTASPRMKRTLEDLQEQLDKMKGLAIPIKLVIPVGPYVRKTAVFPPNAGVSIQGDGSSNVGRKRKKKQVAKDVEKTLKSHGAGEGSSAISGRCIAPIAILVELEAAGGWPVDPTAYVKTKAALGVQLAQELQKKKGSTVHAAEQYVDVIKGGFAFRLHLFSAKDAAQARKGIMSFANDQNQVHGYLSAATSTYPSFTRAVRVLKRWIGSQMLSPHLPGDVLELMMLHVYLDKGYIMPPGSPFTGFIRFLMLAASYPFSHQPLFVDPRDEFSANDFRAISKWYSGKKPEDHKSIGLCISTPIDKHSNITRTGPNPMVVHRLAVKAKDALDAICNLAYGTMLRSTSWMTVFQVQVDYDVLVHFHKSIIPRNKHAVKQPHLEAFREYHMSLLGKEGTKSHEQVLNNSEENLEDEHKLHVPSILVGFDPVAEYVTQLQQRFGALAVFCYDEYGGGVLGIRWLPEAFIPKALDPMNCVGYIPLSGGKDSLVVAPDVMVILEEIWSIGKGLVDDIQIL